MHLALIGLLAVQAASGVVRGEVRDPRGAPIRGAVVGIPGTTLYTFTDAAGRYRLAPVAAGEFRLRAAAIGYSPATTTVTLADSARADFTLDPSPLELTPLDVVSTKVPHFGASAASVAQVSEQEIARRAVNTVDEAVDKAAGVQILNGQINIRGSTGYVQGLNSRVLLLVDGVPMNQGDRHLERRGVLVVWVRRAGRRGQPHDARRAQRRTRAAPGHRWSVRRSAPPRVDVPEHHRAARRR